ncbi:MAG: peptidylprolyl isomerase [Culturomica sp.]|jgi:peptidyl-prolyl cis-trans isomerase D|nr:peptidylprolyl isomerase [Culturomica sp.]
MATLQNIRNRGGILVSIVIGIALFAFIAGDGLNYFSTGGSRTRAGIIAGEKISIIDYQNQLIKNEEFFKSMNGVTALTDDQMYNVRESTWQEFVNSIVMGREYDELGIAVSGDEIYDMIFGNNVNPAVRQLFGAATPDQIRSYITYVSSLPAQDPQKTYWLNIEKQLAESRKQTKYMTLLMKGMYVTDEEVVNTIDNSSEKSDISYIVKNYSTVPDSTVTVSNDEIKRYYNSHKNLYQQNESRRIEYVDFSIEPSAEDYSETRKIVENMISEFTEAENAREFVELSSDAQFDDRYYAKSEITNDSLADFLFKNTKTVYGTYLENEAYKISKVASIKMLPDSIRARHILITPQNNDYMAAKNLADSLADLLRTGKADFEVLARTYSTDEASAVNGGDLGWFNATTMVQPFSDTAFFAKPREIKVAVTQFGAHIIQVLNRSKLVEKIQIATVEKEVFASQATINKVYNNARNFAANVFTNEDFNKKIEESGVTKNFANLGKNDRNVSNITDARDLVRQVYLSKEVNHVVFNDEDVNIFDTGDRFIIAVLTEINEEGTSPINKVSAMIYQEIAREKKAELLKEELQTATIGSQSLLSVAQKTGLTVKDANDISFSSFQITGGGIEPKVIAEASKIEVGKISEPIAGNVGVFMLVVNNRDKMESSMDTMTVKTGMQQSRMSTVTYFASQALLKNAEIKDTRYRFY